MKRYFILAVAVVAMTAACTKSYRTSGLQGENPDETSPVPILFGTNVVSVQTKAYGGVDAWDGKQDLYVYGLSTSLDGVESIAIDNVKAVSPILDAAASPQKDLIAVNDNTGAPYYYQDGCRYDFYAYYADDAAVMAGDAPAVTEGVLNFTINGTQDIMVAKATPEDDIAAAAVPEEKEVTVNNTYTAYSARRGVTPNLVFKHCLTRFVFYVLAGNEASKEVKINNIAVKSKTSGQLVVYPTAAHTELGIIPDEAQEPVFLYLGEKVDDAVVFPQEGENLNVTFDTENPVQVGESIMAMPGETSYPLLLQLSHNGRDYTMDKNSITLPADADAEDNVFKAGNQYVVTIKIYGLEDIKISAELTPWNSVEGPTIDPDNPDAYPARP